MPSRSFNILSPLPLSFRCWYLHHLISSLASSVHPVNTHKSFPCHFKAWVFTVWYLWIMVMVYYDPSFKRPLAIFSTIFRNVCTYEELWIQKKYFEGRELLVSLTLLWYVSIYLSNYEEFKAFWYSVSFYQVWEVSIFNGFITFYYGKLKSKPTYRVMFMELTIALNIASLIYEYMLI